MDNSTTRIEYQGHVIIKVVSGNKILKNVKCHNEGTSWFSRLIASSVLGNNEGVNMPKYLDAGTVGENQGFTSCLSSRVQLTGKQLKKDTNSTAWIASFTAVLPRKSINTGEGSITINQLQVHSVNTGDDKLLATVNLGTGKAITVSASSKSSIIVVWEMKFITSVDKTPAQTTNTSQESNETETQSEGE